MGFTFHCGFIVRVSHLFRWSKYKAVLTNLLLSGPTIFLLNVFPLLTISTLSEEESSCVLLPIMFILVPNHNPSSCTLYIASSRRSARRNWGSEMVGGLRPWSISSSRAVVINRRSLAGQQVPSYFSAVISPPPTSSIIPTRTRGARQMTNEFRVDAGRQKPRVRNLFACFSQPSTAMYDNVTRTRSCWRDATNYENFTYQVTWDNEELINAPFE